MAQNRVPPHNLEAEESVLGALLIDKDAMIRVAEFLRPEHFYKDLHVAIFKAMLSLYEDREPIDIITLTGRMKKNGDFNEAMEGDILAKIVNSVPTSANVEHYARIIQELSLKRNLISVAAIISEMAFNEKGEVKEILDKSEQEIFALSQAQAKRNFLPLKSALAESFDRLDELHKRAGGLRGVSCGFTDLDNTLAGMQPSNLLILAARPGKGKTALVLNMAQHAAVDKKFKVGIFSLEMSKEELVDRLLVSQANVDAWRLKTGKLSDEDFTRLSDAMGELAEAPLFIDDTPGINILEMRTKARRLQVEHGLDMIIVDYLQLADPGRRFDSRVQEVSVISQGLKNLARELKIPVLAVSQLSRAVESRGDGIPQLADLRESGAIEQDADVVMFLYQPAEKDDNGNVNNINNSTRNMKLLIAKHRNGPTAEIDLLFRGDRIRFYNIDKKRSRME